MSTKQRTEWFPGKVKPVRPGVYERHIRTIGVRWSHWDGFRWGGFAGRYKQALENRRFPSGHQNERWRGLARASS